MNAWTAVMHGERILIHLRGRSLGERLRGRRDHPQGKERIPRIASPLHPAILVSIHDRGRFNDILTYPLEFILRPHIGKEATPQWIRTIKMKMISSGSFSYPCILELGREFGERRLGITVNYVVMPEPAHHTYIESPFIFSGPLI